MERLEVFSYKGWWSLFSFHREAAWHDAGAVLNASEQVPNILMLCFLVFCRKPLQDVANEHWKEYGRNYYARYDYEGVDKAKAEVRL